MNNKYITHSINAIVFKRLNDNSKSVLKRLITNKYRWQVLHGNRNNINKIYLQSKIRLLDGVPRRILWVFIFPYIYDQTYYMAIAIKSKKYVQSEKYVLVGKIINYVAQNSAKKPYLTINKILISS